MHGPVTMPKTDSLFLWSLTETKATEAEYWRRGYYDEQRSWEQMGPQAGVVTELARQARALSRQASKRKREIAELKRLRAESSSSSTSSSSSSPKPAND